MLIRVILKEDESLNPIEYLKDQYGDIMYFDSYGEADDYLRKQGFTETQIDFCTFDDCTVTEEEAEKYMARVGYPHDKGDWLLGVKRQSQVRETIDNSYDLCDFDRWQHIQDVLFGNDTDMLDYESSQKIIDVLWEKDIEVMELWSFKDNK